MYLLVHIGERRQAVRPVWVNESFLEDEEKALPQCRTRIISFWLADMSPYNNCCNPALKQTVNTWRLNLGISSTS